MQSIVDRSQAYKREASALDFVRVTFRNFRNSVRRGYVIKYELFMAAKTVGGNYFDTSTSYLVNRLYFVLCFVFDQAVQTIEKDARIKTDYTCNQYMDNQWRNAMVVSNFN